MNHQPIYLDYNATTPLDPRVADAMEPFLRGHFGNPSSSHIFGREARQAVGQARDHVAALLGAQPDEIVFTSGGSESDNMAVFGAAEAHAARGRHLIISAVEHPAISEPCRVLAERGHPLTVLPVDRTGAVGVDDLRAALRDDTVLVSVMHANNEVGRIQPIAELAGLCRDHGIWLHSDAAQSVGKIPVNVDDLGVDLLTVAGHKLYGPKGIGALYIRRGCELPRFIHGAGHESGRRAGTENVLEIVGLGAAARLALEELDSGQTHSRQLRDTLLDALRQHAPEIRVNGDLERGLPNTLSVSFVGLDAAALLRDLGDRVAASPGAACHADGVEMSAVLAAMKVPVDQAMGTVRFSVGRFTTEADVAAAARVVADALDGR